MMLRSSTTSTITTSSSTISKEEKLFLNSLSSDYTKLGYKTHLDKYLKTVGYTNGVQDLLSKTPREIEDDLIQFIISLKERDCKFTTINNYVKPVLAFCKINDITLNSAKISRFIPPYSRNRNTRAYEVAEIQKLLDISDERMRVVILLASSCGCRVGAIPDITLGSLEPVAGEHNDLYKITIYEGELESYITFCSSECKKAIDAYLNMRKIYGEDIENKTHPLIREQFDKRDLFAAAHPKRITRITLKKKLTDMAEAAGIRTRIPLEKGEKGASRSHRKTNPVTSAFRYYYITTLVNAGLKTEHRFLLEGHNLKFNDMFYVHVSHDDLLQSYMLAHDDLLIDQSHKLRRKVEKLEVERDSFEVLRKQIEALEKRMPANS